MSRSLIVVKPDAIERHLEPTILQMLETRGLHIDSRKVVRLSRWDLLRLWEKIHTTWGWLSSQQYMLGHDLPVWWVSGDQAVERVMDLKRELRSRLGTPGDKVRTMIHCPDTDEDFSRESEVLEQLEDRFPLIESPEPISAYVGLELERIHSLGLPRVDLSILQTGSAVDRRMDGRSDWDFHVLVPDHAFREFSRLQENGVSFFNGERKPPALLIVRPFSSLDTEFAENLSVLLWIYERIRYLRDDGDRLKRYVLARRQEFAAQLHRRIKEGYLRMRCARHALDASIGRDEEVTDKLLRSEFLIRTASLAHLIVDQPYPYTQWLMWSLNRYCGDLGVQVGSLAERFMNASGPEASSLSRQITNMIVDALVEYGFARDRLERWWEYEEGPR